jgi:hypothetical protein
LYRTAAALAAACPYRRCPRLQSIGRACLFSAVHQQAAGKLGQELSETVLREPEDGTGQIGAVFHAIKPDGGCNFVENAQSSF